MYTEYSMLSFYTAPNAVRDKGKVRVWQAVDSESIAGFQMDAFQAALKVGFSSGVCLYRVSIILSEFEYFQPLEDDGVRGLGPL